MALIELENVEVRYGDFQALNGISCAIEEGVAVGLLGPNGAGKSTLMKVLYGVNTPQEGEVLYGGVPVKHLGLQNYRQVIGTVMQEDVRGAAACADVIDVRQQDDLGSAQRRGIGDKEDTHQRTVRVWSARR